MTTMTAEEWQARLARQQAAWQDSEAATGSIYSDPPDGDYQFLVYSFDFIDTDSHGAFLKTEVQVANGAHQGKVTSTMHSLEDPDRFGYLKAHLTVLGVDVESTPLSAIHPGSPVLEAVLDTPVEGTVKRSKKLREDGSPYVNVYLNKRLGDPLRAQPMSNGQQQALPASEHGRSDVPGDTSGFDAMVPADTDGDEVPWTDEDLANGPGGRGPLDTGEGLIETPAPTASAASAACICPNYPTTVNNNCPVPGHKIDW